MPNGEDLGYLMGDTQRDANASSSPVVAHRTTAANVTLGTSTKGSHAWGIFFTILGTVLLDFDADACQSPARAYLLDVTVPGM